MRCFAVMALLLPMARVAFADANGGCTDEDQAAIGSLPSGTGDGSFGSISSKCGYQAYSIFYGFNQEKFRKCVEGSVPISDGCAGCFAQHGDYTSHNCVLACMTNWCSKACIDCSNQDLDNLNGCAGYSTPTVSPCDAEEVVVV
mmetsp:Transcript_46776/g.111263  ORF Transcript_46776/g.111263 Transcript_46776/m.111263 type:complete len:144 (-) Transcript_46776:220-651(-)